MTSRAGTTILERILDGREPLLDLMSEYRAAIEQEVRDDIRAKLTSAALMMSWSKDTLTALVSIVGDPRPAGPIAISSSSATETQDGERSGHESEWWSGCADHVHPDRARGYCSAKFHRLCASFYATPTPDDRDREPGTLFDVDWWQRNLSTRNGSDRAMAEFVVQTLDFAWPFVSTLRHPDDRDREVERIAVVLHETKAVCMRPVELCPPDHDIHTGWAERFYDAGLRASGGTE